MDGGIRRKLTVCALETEAIQNLKQETKLNITG